LAGCAQFHPQPIDPVSSLNAIEARSLTDSALARFLTSSRAAVEWPPRSWDLPALTLVAFFYNPDLDIVRSQWAAARGALMAAGKRPNPGVTGGPGYNATTPVADITPWILSLNLDFTITTAGKRSSQIAAARHQSESARLAVASAAWSVRQQVRQQSLDLYAATRAIVLLERQQRAHELNVSLLARRLAAGEISPFELAQARLLDGANRASLNDARRQEAEARVSLAAALGLTVHALDGITLAFDAFERPAPALPGTDVRRQALLNRADVLGALERYEASQSALRLEIARQYPDIHLGPGYQMDQDNLKWSLDLGGVLPVFNRNRGAIAEAEARRTEAAATFTSVQSKAIEQVDGAVAAYTAATATLVSSDALVADRERMQRSAAAQFAAGEISRVDLAAIELTLAGAEAERLNARVRAQQALGRLEDAMQSPAVFADWVFTDPSRTPPTKK
jgi:outer membrane protein TolC